MAYGFSGTLDEFFGLVRAGTVGSILSETRKQTGAHGLSDLEQTVWNADAGAIARVLREADIPAQRTHLLLTEYDIPGHLGRCDVVLLGASGSGERHGGVFELKRWRDFEPAAPARYVRVSDRLHLHPSEQVLHYRDLLRFFHEQGDRFVWHAGAWMTEMGTSRASLLNALADDEAPVWSLQTLSPDLLAGLHDWFCGGIDAAEVEHFLKAGCRPSARMAEQLGRLLPGLTRGVAVALGGKPLDLTPRQEEVVSAISAAVRRHAGRFLLVISGDPGCGKTVVGVRALIGELARGPQDSAPGEVPRVVLALRNSRLCSVLRSAIDASGGPRIGRALIQYVRGGGPGIGIQPEVERRLRECPDELPIYDLLVLDEAHRIPHLNPRASSRGVSQLEAVLRAGRVVVCLLDEGQILNEDDAGTRATISKLWKQLWPNDPIVELSLEDQHRVPADYSAWLSRLLGGVAAPYTGAYELLVADSPAEVIEALRARAKGRSCGLLASYTVTNGRQGNTLRVAAPPTHWLMDVEEYNAWWSDPGVRHRFDRCASVYGCQGFELDYAGVFWGRDLSMAVSNGRTTFSLCRPHDITDDIGMAYGKKLRTLADEAQRAGDGVLVQAVCERLLNRYRILLSRGRCGTIICCEDPQTAAALRSCIRGSR